MQLARLIPLSVFLSVLASGQSIDTGTAHKAAATALLNSNNAGAARLACPAAIFPEPVSNPPGGGPARGAGIQGATEPAAVVTPDAA